MAADDLTGSFIRPALGSLCPNCRRAVRECVCPKGAPGAARARRRAGGPGDPGTGRQGRHHGARACRCPRRDIEALATRLKKRCGAGGTVQDGVIEIQGEHRDVVVAELIKLGLPPRRSGG